MTRLTRTLLSLMVLAMIDARAVKISEPGGPEVLAIAPHQVRAPGAGELLVEVAAAGLNRADTLQRRGFYPAPAGAPADVPGLEYAGTVAATGPGVLDLSVGDRVMGIVAGGAMSTHVVVHEREAIPAPEGLSLHEAAAIPEVFLTAFDAVHLQAGLRMGETLLVHAIGSGIGTAALQLANAAGAAVIGTSRTPEKLERAAGLGLERGILVVDGRFAEQVSADLILDTVGGAYLNENLKALKPRGRMITIGLMGGRAAEASLGLLLRKRLTLIGTVLRSRPLEEKGQLVQAFIKQVLPGFAAGRFRPVIDEVLPMSEIAQAHRRMDASETFGKLVLRW